MVIEHVIPVNFNIIEDAFYSGLVDTRTIAKNFGKNIHNVLSHIEISFVVSGISILEAYMMKKFANGNIVDLETYMDDNKIDQNSYPVTYRNMQSLFLLNKSINSDNDVSVKPGALLFPAKCVEKKCIVVFRGSNIMAVTGQFENTLDCFFNKLNKLMTTQPDVSKEQHIQNLLIESFYKEFYSFMMDRIQYMDLLSDSVLNFLYLQHAESQTSLVSLSHINTLYGTIPLLGIEPEVYQNALDNITTMKNTIGIQDTNTILQTTDVFFLCNTSFHAFLELFMYLPLGSVLETTDIKSIYQSSNYTIPQEMKKYQARVSTIIEKMHNERIQQSKTSIDDFALIPLNTKIQYTVRFKLSEISDILLGWESAIYTNKIYGDDTLYLTKEIKKIISDMKSYSIAGYNAVIS